MFRPIYGRMRDDALTAAAMQARAYMDRFGVTEEQCAKVSVKNHANAKNNPYAHSAGPHRGQGHEEPDARRPDQAPGRFPDHGRAAAVILAGGGPG